MVTLSGKAMYVGYLKGCTVYADLDGDLQQALRYLMQRGMDGDEGSTLRGLREMLKQLKEQRRDRLERYDMGSILDDIREQLEDILRMEQETIDEWVDRKAPDGDADPARHSSDAGPDARAAGPLSARLRPIRPLSAAPRQAPTVRADAAY